MAFGEDRLLRLLRSKTAGAVGTVVAVVAFGLLLRQAIGSGEARLSLSSGVGALTVALAAFLVFQLAAAGLLTLLGAHPGLRLWAVAQVIKYLPTPGSAVAGMMTGAIRSGYDLRRSLGFVTRHSGLLAGTAVVSGTPVLASFADRRIGVPLPLGAVAAVALGLVVAYVSVRRLPVRRQALAIVAGALVWTSLGLILWATAGDGRGDALVVGSSFPAAWVIGLLALPVPAGLGIREGALVLLLDGHLSTDAALSYGIVTRLLQVASDGLFALVVIGGERLLPTTSRTALRHWRDRP